MNDQYKVFLNVAVSARFSAMSPAERKRFAEKMRFLAAGIWEGGILVKKLAGHTRKVLFEARVSKGDRILFTLGKYLDTSAVYVWALLKHDDVDRKARIGMPGNAPFLDFPTSTEEHIDNLYLDSVREPWHTQEGEEDKVESDYGPQKWNVLDDEEWERALAAEKSEELEYHLFLSREQYSVLERNPPLLVSGTAGSGKTTIALYYLSKKEYLGGPRLFTTYSPYLRDFAAKLYRGLVKGNLLDDRPPYPEFLTIEEAQRRFIPASSPLADATKLVGLGEFRSIVAANPLSKKFDPELLWEEIRSIIKGAMPPYSLKRLETLAQKLCSGLASTRERQELAAELADLARFPFGGKMDDIVAASFESVESFASVLGSGPQEDEQRLVLNIVDFLRKKKELFTRPLLSLEEYLYLGEKRAPNFLYDRGELYAIATYYQKKLEERGLYDEIDLAKRALAERKCDESPPVWDLVVCDEIQDMTDTHIEFLFDLCADRNKVFFAGDERQTVNPSGFRWEGVRSRFYESGTSVPDLIHLSLNFRSTGSIVEVGNALLDLKKTFIGAGKFEDRETWKFLGKAPVVIDRIQEEKILEIVRQSGADRIILVRSAEEKLRLKSILGTELVFTILEAKGLEFETVLLWKFVENRETDDLWNAMCERSGGVMEDMIPHLRHELSLLYVAITRTRSILAVYDGEKPSAVWNAGRLPSLVVRAKEVSFLVESWSKASTPVAWSRQGDALNERLYYRAAAECYRNAGNVAKEDLALAWVAFQDGDYRDAAPRFERQGELARSAFCFEKAGDLDKARLLYARLGDKEASKRLRVLVLEKDGDFSKAGKIRLKMGETAAAIEDWEKGNEQALLAKHYAQAKDLSKAARCYEKSGNLAEAITCYKKSRDYEKAAELLLASGSRDAAMKLFRKAGGSPGYLDFCKRTGRPELIARAYLELGKREDALRLYKEYLGSDKDAAKILLGDAAAYASKRMHENAAILYTALDSHGEAGEAYKKAGETEKAAKAFSLAGRHRDAALLYEKHGNDEEAVAEWKAFAPDDHEGRVKKVRSIYDLQWKLLKRRPTKERGYDQTMANALFDEASDCLDSGDYLNALAIMIQFKEKEPVLDCLAHVADDMLAAYIISFSGDYSQWTEYRKGRRTISLDPLKAADYLTSSFSYIERPKKASVTHIDGFLLFLKDISSFAGTINLELLRAVLELPLTYCDECLNRDRPSILRWGNDLFQVFAALKDYYKIISVGSTWHVSRASDKDIEKLIDSLDDLAISRGDDILRLCKATIKGQNVDPAVLENATVDMNTWSILRCYTITKEKVVDFLVREMLIADAAECLAYFGEFSRAAELLEKHKLLNDAASYYERAKDWQKAEALYARLGNEKYIARMYEHKGDFSAAISLWKKLGYPKQVERLEKKMKVDTVTNAPPLSSLLFSFFT